MRCLIIYFSQTGNTEKVAYAIQSGVKEAAGHCDIMKIKDVNPRRLYDYDLIGLGSPVYGTEPLNVRAFINRMRFVGGKHLFVFATHGTLPGLFFGSIVPNLVRRGLVVVGTHSCYGKCYLPLMPNPYPTDGHPDEIDLKEAADFGKKMVEHSMRITAGETELIPPLPQTKPPMPKPEDSSFFEMVEKFQSMMVFHEKKCAYPDCRLCMDNCPIDGIDLSVKPPVVAKPCLMCSFCWMICPTGAIDISPWAEAMGTISEEVVRATHWPILDEAEAAGRFRRLLPIEKIGYGTSIYQAIKKHPKWIIGKGLQ
jgi:flavodoxin